jgi:hypothetical protein
MRDAALRSEGAFLVGDIAVNLDGAERGMVT